MDLRQQFDEVLSELVSERLKFDGYRKERRTLVRSCKGYVERLYFQADRYNVPTIRCAYFLNVGLEVPGLSPAVLDLHKRHRFYYRHRGKDVSAVDFHKDVAWSTRADSLV